MPGRLVSVRLTASTAAALDEAAAALGWAPGDVADAILEAAPRFQEAIAAAAGSSTAPLSQRRTFRVGPVAAAALASAGVPSTFARAAVTTVLARPDLARQILGTTARPAPPGARAGGVVMTLGTVLLLGLVAWLRWSSAPQTRPQPFRGAGPAGAR